jgi:hypothetical protein
MHSALRELRQLRGKDAKAWDSLPKSPYLDEDQAATASPRSTAGKREQEAPQPPVKNEPVSALTHLTASADENSLVQPVGDVAVATSSVPAGSSGATSENETTPDALVVTDSAPTSDLPPPAKTSM